MPSEAQRKGEEGELPRLSLIADRFTEAAIADRTVAAVESGVQWVHLRDHAASEDAFAEAARRLAGRLHAVANDLLISINTRLEVAKAMKVGLHLGARGPLMMKARERLGKEVPIGFSAHDEVKGRAAVAGGADYLFFSPVFPTASKPSHPGAGLYALSALCKAFPETPVLALGGITPDRVSVCLEAGAYGVAVLSGILHAHDPAAAAHAYLGALPMVK